jgi:DNA primase
MIDVQSIKSQITQDNIIVLMDSLGADYNFASSQEIHFKSICHNSDSYKLYWYKNNNGGNFYCHRDAKSWDVISLVEHIKNINFQDALLYICKTLGLNVNESLSKNNIDPWQKSLSRWISKEQKIEKLTVYNADVLNLFSPYYNSGWLEYGITKEIMERFNIGWYDRLACITIPVFFNNELVGIRGRFTRKQDIENGKYRPLATLDKTTYKFPTSSVLYGYDQNKTAIEKSHKVLLFESEKSVLKAASWGINNALAVFGSNISKRHIDLLLELSVSDICICFDSDYKNIGDDEYNYFIEKIKKNIKKLRPYFSLSVCYNNLGYDGYKYSPVDFSYNEFIELYKHRIVM